MKARTAVHVNLQDLMSTVDILEAVSQDLIRQLREAKVVFTEEEAHSQKESKALQAQHAALDKILKRRKSTD